MTERDSTSSVPENLFGTLDDETLIRRFARGKKRLVFNHNLKLNYSHQSLQLCTPEGELVGIHKINDKNIHYILVNKESSYWQFVHQIILEYHFIPLAIHQDRGYFRYQKYQLPENYELRYTTAWDLLVKWREYTENERFEIDIFVLIKGKWYRLQKAEGDDLGVKLDTVVREVAVASTQEIAWIFKVDIRRKPLELPAASPEKLPTTEVTLQLPELQEPPSDASSGDRQELLAKIAAKLAIAENPPAPSGSHSNPQIESPLPVADLELFDQIFTIEPDSQDYPQRAWEMRLQALDLLAEYIEKGETITRTEIMTDARGNKVGEKIVTIQRGCPRWAIETAISLANEENL